MWNEKSRRINQLERKVNELEKIICTHEHAVPQSNESIGNEIAAQIALNRELYNIVKQLSTHYKTCPACQKESFLRYNLEAFHYSNGSWRFTISYNRGLTRGERPYRGSIDLVPIRKIVMAMQHMEYSCWDFDLYRCVCGHEWIELTDKQQEYLYNYIRKELGVNNEAEK